ncbi:acyltransferase family protein [Lentiprolixibacter aurantiacus]|uniref:Acyltransferase family protein n=1 Tax=Lentiprolixibacter aurantiacus TaxID=2993939 RepID=A0AAE3MIY2_9FLAO|nr:acyltransferase family protein [Lentiprolixibacter aurantiacus]MCX2718645.1 acyltransferase family protein [Lentiprolixibacter aurantiacus]
MTSNKRLYYLDWLRVLAFGLLFVFHSWRPFDHLEWHIKNEEQHTVFDALTMFTHGWRMHVIFLVSGAGTYFAMRSRKGKFIADRVKRLIVPFLFGIVILIPPQRFYEWKMFQNFDGGFLDFLNRYPIEQLDANMGASLLLWFGHLGTHLWYLPYLFFMTILCIPLFTRIQQGKIKFNGIKGTLSAPFGVFILVIPMLASRLLLKPVFEGYTDWGDFFIYLWPFVYGFIFMAESEFIDIIKSRRHLLLIVGILSSIIFMYLGATSDQMVQAYTSPEFDLLHVLTSTLAVLIALSWTLFFLGLFATKLDCKHSLLRPANISILPVYILHQTLIIVIGYYIILTDLNLFIKFGIIAFTAIPASILLYQLIRTNNITRFVFGLKPPKKHL